MTTKGPSHKQIIIPMSNEMARRYIKDASTHIISINHTLKTIKLNIMANFICIEDKGIMISTNNVASPSDLQEIKKCVKSSLLNDADQISPSRLPQLKSYLKIIGIPYLNEQSNMHILSENIEKILKSNHIFNNIVLTSRPRVIKVSLSRLQEVDLYFLILILFFDLFFMFLFLKLRVRVNNNITRSHISHIR